MPIMVYEGSGEIAQFVKCWTGKREEPSFQYSGTERSMATLVIISSSFPGGSYLSPPSSSLLMKRV